MSITKAPCFSLHFKGLYGIAWENSRTHLKLLVMASVHDIAAYILQKAGPMTAMKLQKLVYYTQAWSLVWEDRPIFAEKIEAWANGPVVPALYECHRGLFRIYKLSKGDPNSLNEEDQGTVDSVLDFYGGKTSQWLSDLTHSEDPWIQARSGALPGEWCDKEITHASMAEYYGSL